MRSKNLSRHTTIRLSGPREQECGCLRSFRTLHVRRHPHTRSFRGLHGRFLQKLRHRKVPTGTKPCVAGCTSISFTDLHFQYVCRSVSPLRGYASSMFHAESNHRSKFIRSELMNTTGRGVLWHSRKKNLQTSLPCGRSPRIFLSECRTPLCSRRAAGSTSEQTSNSDYTH